MVAGLNLDGLNNLTPITINTSIVDTPKEIVPNMMQNTNNLTLDFYGLMAMIVLFITITYLLNRDDEIFRVDFIRSILLSSGIVLILGSIAAISGLFNDFRHVIWFLTIVVISLIAILRLKEKAQ